jgi:DNA-directed RNA polymerase subunit H (RpoH/RPB5)
MPINIFRVRRTIRQMMNDRGYKAYEFTFNNETIVSQQNRDAFENWFSVDERVKKDKISPQSFMAQMAKYAKSVPPTLNQNEYGALTIFSMYIRENDDGTKKKLWVVFYPEVDGTIGVEPVSALMSQITNLNIDECIFITSNKFHRKAEQVFEGHAKSMFLQHFLYEELEYNATHHVFVPKHIGLDEVESKQFFITNPQIKKTNLPILNRNDPQAKYYGFKQGTIVKIERINLRGNDIINEAPFYRCVF